MAAADQDRDQRELRFRELYQANFRPVQGYAVNRLGSADDVPDVNLANAELQAKIMPIDPLPVGGVAVNIRPAAIPHGIGLYLKAWAASPGTHSGPALSLQVDLVQATPQCTG
jgi:hypothetical protein